MPRSCRLPRSLVRLLSGGRSVSIVRRLDPGRQTSLVLTAVLLAAPLVPGPWAEAADIVAQAGLSTPPAPRLPSPAAPARSSAPVAPALQAPSSSGSDPAGGNGLVTIESDSQRADNRTGIVTAIGNVRIVYPAKGLVATARQAQYFSREARLVLSGDVDVVDRDGQRIQAERLVYQLDSERLQAQPASGRQVITRLRLQAPPGQAPGPLLP